MVTNKDDLESPTSHLIVHSVVPSDGGTYTCKPSEAEEASIVVHIIDGTYNTILLLEMTIRLKIQFISYCNEGINLFKHSICR